SGGFKPYFVFYQKAKYSYFPNGVDDIFIEANKAPALQFQSSSAIKTIVYAGNLGEGQGLHKIVPQTAKALEGHFKFLIIGDGGIKQKLTDEFKQMGIKNVVFRAPVKRDGLIAI